MSVGPLDIFPSAAATAAAPVQVFTPVTRRQVAQVLSQVPVPAAPTVQVTPDGGA